MWVWRRRAGARWLAANEGPLRELAGARLAIIQKANGKTATLEIAGINRSFLDDVRAKFGGSIKRLPRNWLSRFSSEKIKPIRIGKRLIIVKSSASAIRSRGTSLIIPAGSAFGTGEHPTTAMSLRLLERLSRNFRKNWSMLDLGTGSGILALAAKRLGAKKVVAIDSDAMALSTATQNARSNRIDRIDFQLGEARAFSNAAFTVVTANLFSELLVEILPKLKQSEWLIFSGVLRKQEPRVVRALQQNKFCVVKKQRRGKWVALLSHRSSAVRFGGQTGTRGARASRNPPPRQKPI